jgi:hypothetical protein
MSEQSIWPGDLVRENRAGSPRHRVSKVEGGIIFSDGGARLTLAKVVVVERGPVSVALRKAREQDGSYTGRKFKPGDKVKVTGQVPTKGKKGTVAMINGQHHVVTHADGSHGDYEEKYLSHDTERETKS